MQSSTSKMQDFEPFETPVLGRPMLTGQAIVAEKAQYLGPHSSKASKGLKPDRYIEYSGNLGWGT